MQNRQIVVEELPKGALTPDNFKLTESDMPVPADGEVLLRVILMSIDAANRSWMQGATYRAAVKAGDAMPTYAICEVVESNSDRLEVGDVVAAEATWSDYITLPAHKAQKLPKVPELSNLMSVFGIAGKTAYHGLMSVGQPQPGAGLRRRRICRWLCGTNRQKHRLPRSRHRRRSGKMRLGG